MSKNLNLKTDEGSTIKNFLDLCHSVYDKINIEITTKGLKSVDVNNDGTIMMDINLVNTFFTFYQVKKDVKFSIESANLPKLMKTIKKEDKVRIFATEPEKISIKIKNKKDERGKLNNIPIHPYNPRTDELPPSYGDVLPTVVVNSGDFQKMCKSLGGIDKNVSIIAQDKAIRFSVESPTIGDTAEHFGKWKKDGEKIFELILPTKSLTDISKCSTLSKHKKLRIYAIKGLPLRISTEIGGLGTLEIYLTPSPQKEQ